MRVLKFLKSRAGAISKAGALGLGLTVGLVGLNVYNYATDTTAAQEKEVRSLSAIMASGGELPAAYSGINVSRGANEFATAEERAAREGTLFDGGEGAVAALGGIDGVNVRGSALGSGEAGLGMGANAAAQLGPDGKPLTGNVNADGSAVGAAAADANQTKINKLGEAKEGDLQRASMARAGGSNLGSGGGAAGLAGSSSLRASARGEAERRMGSSSISGAMPEGSTLVASNSGLLGAASSSLPGGRESRVGRGINSKEGNSLRQIAVDSSKVAANKNRGANEGTRPFMADTKLSGGVNVVGETANTSVSGANDFEGEMNAREKGAAQAIDDIDTTEQERKEHRTRLQKMLFGTLAITIVAMLSIGTLMKAALSGSWWNYVAAAAIAAVALTVIGFFIADASQYISKYGSDGWSIASIVMGILMVGGIAVSFVKGAYFWLAKAAGTLTKGFGMQLLSGAVLGTGVSMGVNTTIESIKATTSDKLDSGSDSK